MNNRPLVSVAIITYNHEKYIHKAIDSVIEQSIIEEIDINIGDDGSTDRTIEIVEKYKDKYNFISIYAHENMGISENVYDLFLRCKGQYIAVLEGDDFWIDKFKLEKQLKQIQNNGCIAAASNSRIENDKEEILGFRNSQNKDIIVDKYLVEKKQVDLWMPSTLMFKNIFYDSAGKYSVIRTASRMGGNHSGMINLLGSIGKIYLSKDSYAVYRYNVEPKGSNYSSSMHDKIEDDIESLKKYLTYSKTFGMDYHKQISLYYCRLIRKINGEVKAYLGFYDRIRCKVHAFIRFIIKKY